MNTFRRAHEPYLVKYSTFLPSFKPNSAYCSGAIKFQGWWGYNVVPLIVKCPFQFSSTLHVFCSQSYVHFSHSFFCFLSHISLYFHSLIVHDFSLLVASHLFIFLFFLLPFSPMVLPQYFVTVILLLLSWSFSGLCALLNAKNLFRSIFITLLHTFLLLSYPACLQG